MKELRYKSNNNVILQFHKSSLWSWGLHSFSETCIGLSSTKFSDALSLNRINNDLWEIKIDWDSVSMNSLEESFFVSVSYSGNTKISEEVKIKFSPISVSPEVFDYVIQPDTKMWGTPGKVGTLYISLKDNYAPWMFNTNVSTITFELSDQIGFIPVVDGKSKSFSIDQDWSIDLKYVGYEKESPIKETVTKKIVFEINEIEFSVPFCFTPRPYSYEAKVHRLKEVYRYGDKDRDLFRICIKRCDEYSPIAETISPVVQSSFNDVLTMGKEGDDQFSWLISFKKDVNYNLLIRKIVATISFNIDKCKSKCDARLSLGQKVLPDINYIRILPGAQPNLSLLPTPTLKLYKGEKGRATLIVKNLCDEEISVTNILFGSDTNTLQVSGERKQKIAREKDKAYHFDVDTSVALNKTIHIVVQTHETLEASIDCNVIVLERPNAIVAIEPIEFPNETEDQYTIVVGEDYKKDTSYVRCRIGYAKESPSDSLLIDLSDIDFGEKYRLLLDESVENTIPQGQTRDVNLVFNEDVTISLEDIQKQKKNKSSEDDINKNEKKGRSSYILPCSWCYFEQTGTIKIPVTMPSMYKKEIVLYEKEIVFPRPEDKRALKVFEYNFIELTGNDSGKYWAKNQKIVIQSPFSFELDGMVFEKSIVPGEKVSFYLHFDEIEGIDKDANNINEPITLVLQGDILADNHNPVSIILQKVKDNNGNVKKILPEITVSPIIEKAKRRVFFRTNKEDVRLLNGKRVQVPVQILQQSGDIEALLLGNIVVQNISKIPYKDNCVKLAIKSVSIKNNNQEILHKRTLELLPPEIEIKNGGPEFCIPIYIDFKLWEKETSSSMPVLRIEFSRQESTIDNLESEGGTSVQSEFFYEAFIAPTYLYVDNVYSLDLGTTGIVVAKETDDEPECVILEDEDYAIEEDKEILSSHTMIISKDNENFIILAPAADTYYTKPTREGTSHYRLVPSKFIVGQDRIPFLSRFYDNEVSKVLNLFKLKDETVDLSIQRDKKVNEETIAKLVASLYKEIFRRFNQEIDKVEKLVVTYPNTYTIENLEGIRDLLVSELKLDKNGQISFVPESDAVAAYYFNQKIYFDKGFLDENGEPRDEENIVFYDMGAGTLDLSLVSFKKDGDDGVIASIINKIGIPLAGNYLDYIIFHTLLEDNLVKPEMVEKHNTIKEITKDIKINYEKEESIEKLNPSWFGENQNLFVNKELLGKKRYSDIFKDKIEEFLTVCSLTALKCLIPDGVKVQTIVFSGRGSQFGVLRRRVEDALKELMGTDVNIKVDKLRQIEKCGDHLKTCVALGALKYQTYFNNNGPFKIRNRNLYSKLAVVYWGKVKGGYDVDVKYLLDPIDAQKVDWETAEFVDGTLCMELDANETICNIVPGMMYYVQTSLGEEALKDLYRKVYQKDPNFKNDLNWAFVNLLFKKKVSSSDPFKVKLKISKDNKIVEREIGGDVLVGEKLLENVEDNILYRRSMWPFITTL